MSDIVNMPKPSYFLALYLVKPVSLLAGMKNTVTILVVFVAS